MALLFFDGFEDYNNATDWGEKNTNSPLGWASVAMWFSGLSTSVVRTPQTVLSAKSAYADWNFLAAMQLSPVSTIVTGFAFRPGSTNTRVCVFTEGLIATYGTNPTKGINIFYNTSNKFEIRNENADTVLGTTTLSYPINVWHYLEVKYVFGSGTSGACELRIDGQSVINLTGINTANTATAIDCFALKADPGGAGICYYDDFYILDTTGTTNNDYLGPVNVYTHYPTGAGSSTQMTPSAGANYTCVDEQATNTTDYVTANAPGLTDLYAMSDLPSSPASILGVMVKARSQRSTASNSSISLAVKSGGTTGLSSPVTVSSAAYVNTYGIFQTSPSGSAWDATSVNAIEAGIKS